MNSRKKILNTIKEEMIANIEALTLENINEIDESNKELLGYAYYLVEVDNLTEPLESEYIPKETNETEPIIVDDHDNLPKDSGIFERKLSHGFIETHNGEQIFVPESIIREKQFEHGDIIGYECIRETAQGKKLYEYNLIQKSNTKHPDRIHFHEGIVQTRNIDNKLVIYDNAYGEHIMDLQDGVTIYEVTDKDLEQFELKPNDIVDIAWYKNNPDGTKRIIWKY